MAKSKSKFDFMKPLVLSDPAPMPWPFSWIMNILTKKKKYHNKEENDNRLYQR